MAATKLYAANALLRNRLVRFGLTPDMAEQIATKCAIPNPHAKHGGYQPALDLCGLRLNGLRLAEHVARVSANWDRCYHIDTTRLAMSALRDAAQ